jgi:hypothetical protein
MTVATAKFQAGLFSAIELCFNPMKRFLAQIALGRMFLHVGCICRGGKVGFHMEGLRREIRQISRAFIPLRRTPKRTRRK